MYVHVVAQAFGRIIEKSCLSIVTFKHHRTTIRRCVLIAAWAGNSVAAYASGAHYALDVSGVTNRQLMQSWDSQWISEYEEMFAGYEWQVDPVTAARWGCGQGAGTRPLPPRRSGTTASS